MTAPIKIGDRVRHGGDGWLGTVSRVDAPRHGSTFPMLSVDLDPIPDKERHPVWIVDPADHFDVID